MYNEQITFTLDELRQLKRILSAAYESLMSDKCRCYSKKSKSNDSKYLNCKATIATNLLYGLNNDLGRKYQEYFSGGNPFDDTFDFKFIENDLKRELLNIDRLIALKEAEDTTSK